MTPYLLHQLLAQTAQRSPEREAIIFGDHSLTYGELDVRSDRICSALRAMGVSVGERVGIRMGKSVESIVFAFAILKAGAAYVPIDHRAPEKRVDFILRNCDIRVLFSAPEGVAGLLRPSNGDCPLRTIVISGKDPAIPPETAAAPVVLRAEELEVGGDGQPGSFDLSDTNPAYILHTSGSTGMPKGVCLSHLNALTFINMAADFFGIRPEDRLGCHAPLQFDLTVFDIFVAVAKGSTVVLVPEHLSIFPVKLAQFVEDRKISVWNSVASVLSLLAERGGLDRFAFDALTTVIFSGDVLPMKHLRKLKGRMPNARFFNVYGQTEANSSMVYPVTDLPPADAWKIPIGKPFPNFEVFALADDGGVVDRSGQIGELYVRSSSVAGGYWGDDARTSESFVTDPRSSLSNRKVYRTGDLVMLDEDRDYVFVGRKDHQVKSRGYRIQLNEIEAMLNNHPAIKEAVAIAVPDELLGNRILCHVSIVDGVDVVEQALYQYCSKTLPVYMLPEKIIFHPDLPKTPTGKIDRASLKEHSIP